MAASVVWAMLAIPAQVTGQPASTKLPVGIVARVSETTITAEQVLERLNEVEKTLSQGEQRLRRAYSYLMYLEILRAEAKRLGVTVSEDERRAIVKQQIEAAQEELRKRHAGSVPWERYVAELGFTPASFEAMVFERSEQILLKRRLVWMWEYACPSVGYLQFIARSETAATKVLEEIETKLDLARKRIAARGPGAGDPAGGDPPAKSVLWPEGTTFAHNELKDTFWNVAQLKSESRSNIVNDAWKDAPLVEPVHSLLFDKLKSGESSGVIKVNDEMWVVVFLDRKSPGTTKPYSELKEMLDQRPDPSEIQYERWIRAVLRSARYDVEYRIPGEPVRKPVEDAKPGDKAPSNDGVPNAG